MAGEEVTEILIKHGADVNVKNNLGETPLFNIYSQEKKADILIQNGADVNVKNNQCETPLDRTENLAIARLLLKAGADSSKYPFHYAILMENMGKVKKFISEGIDINKKGKNFTPMQYAVFTENIEITKLLINNGADMVQDNPLFMAVAYDRVKMAEFLIKEGADVNAIGYQGHTPLDYARSKDMMELLFKYGAKRSGVRNR